MKFLVRRTVWHHTIIDAPSARAAEDMADAGLDNEAVSIWEYDGTALEAEPIE